MRMEKKCWEPGKDEERQDLCVRTYPSLVSIGECWCVNENGEEMLGTRKGRGEARPVCEDQPLPECPEVCTAQYEPKCGSNGVTYSNLCELQRAACDLGSTITSRSDGRCEDLPEPEPELGCTDNDGNSRRSGETWDQPCGQCVCRQGFIACPIVSCYDPGPRSSRCVLRTGTCCPEYDCPEGCDDPNGVYHELNEEWTLEDACRVCRCTDSSQNPYENYVCERVQCERPPSELCRFEEPAIGQCCPTFTCPAIDPPEVFDGECPFVAIKVGIVGTCSNLCESNAECLSKQKCCPNECGGTSCMDALSVPEPKLVEPRNCNEACPRIFRPVCASDGNTYNNDCLMTLAACEQGIEITVASQGECTPGPEPLPQTGVCPSVANEPAGFGVCAFMCNIDSDCGASQKCCPTACGGASCMEPVQENVPQEHCTDYHGNQHKIGETYLGQDGCNQCQCMETGSACTERGCEPAGPCSPNPCENTGECRVRLRRFFTCTCLEGYIGRTCQTQVCRDSLGNTYHEGALFTIREGCATCTCLNGEISCPEVTCPQRPSSQEVRCSSGGDTPPGCCEELFCEMVCPATTPIVTCAVSPCDTETCAADPTATCVPNYCNSCSAVFFDISGNRVDCQRNVSPIGVTSGPCNPNPCINGGVCRRKAFFFYECACAPGFRGTQCEEMDCPPGVPIGTCLAEPCSVGSCPNHPDARCFSNYCGGCNAVFYDVRGNAVECGNEPVERPGVCPEVKPLRGGLLGACENTCTDDSECAAQQKCCATSCGGTSCIEAVLPSEEQGCVDEDGNNKAEGETWMNRCGECTCRGGEASCPVAKCQGPPKPDCIVNPVADTCCPQYICPRVCQDVCTFQYDPKCGSDDVTYSNLCQLENAACQQDVHITVVFDGLCEDRPVEPITCVDRDGNARSEGDTWQEPCGECTCVDGVSRCPLPRCIGPEHPLCTVVKDPNACCPTYSCPEGCLDGGKIRSFGDVWKPNPCVSCSCERLTNPALGQTFHPTACESETCPAFQLSTGCLYVAPKEDQCCGRVACQNQNVECPADRPVVNCFVSPCDVSTCPADTTAQCVTNYCGGCNAIYYDRNGNEVDCFASATKCQIAVRDAGEPLPGAYIPQCTETGEYVEIQCHGSIGHCWCVDQTGIEIEGSRRVRGQGQPVCSGLNPPTNLQASATSPTDVTLTWEDNYEGDDQRSYEIRYKAREPANSEWQYDNTLYLELDLTNLQPSTMYDVGIRVNRDNERSVYASTSVETAGSANKLGQCPVVEGGGGGFGLCAFVCQDDSSCPTTQKCCPTSCGGTSCMEVVQEQIGCTYGPGNPKANGESWEGPCGTCTCTDNVATCPQPDCPPPPSLFCIAKHGEACCPTYTCQHGCDYGGKMYDLNAVWNPDPCTTCTCIKPSSTLVGPVFADCEQIPCPEPVSRPGCVYSPPKEDQCCGSVVCQPEDTFPPDIAALRSEPKASSVVITWQRPQDSPTTVLGYIVSYGTQSPAEQVIRFTPSPTSDSYTITGLEPSTQYIIKLVAYNSIGESTPLLDSVTTLAREVPPPSGSGLDPPVGLQSFPISSTIVRLTWEDNYQCCDQRSYEIRYKVVGSNDRWEYVRTPSLSYDITNLQPGTRYEFEARVIRDGERSLFGVSSFAGTSSRDLAAPTNLRGTVTSSSTVRLEWEDNYECCDQRSYEIRYKAREPANSEWQFETTVYIAEEIGLLRPDTVYDFSVRVLRDAEMSEYTLPFSTRTSECPAGSSIGRCLRNPCERASCPPRPNATCRATMCDGCRAVFYDENDVEINCAASIFKEEPVTSYVVRHSQPVTLTCSAEAPRQAISYECNGQVMDVARVTYGSVDAGTTASIDISRSEVEQHIGEDKFYCQCLVLGEDQQLYRSEKAYVAISYLRKQFTREPIDTTVPAGSRIRLPCIPPDGVPAPIVSWFKDSQPLNVEADDNLTILESGDLEISVARETDEGSYFCSAINNAHNRRSASAFVEIL